MGPEFDLTAKGRKLLEKIFSMPIPAKAPMAGALLKATSVTLRTIGSEMAERVSGIFPPTICPKHTSFDSGNAMIVMELAAVWARSDQGGRSDKCPGNRTEVGGADCANSRKMMRC